MTATHIESPQRAQWAQPAPAPVGQPAPAARPARDRPDSEATTGLGRRAYHLMLVVLWLGVALVGVIQGFDYYRLPLQERAFSPLHDTFKPAGSIGEALGIAGAVMMLVGVSMYSVRKRVGFLARLGKLKYWLEIHIFLCTLGPFLIVLHTSLRFGGIVSIAFWSMAVVVSSGILGRYVYAHIPKTINGRFLTMKAIEEERDLLLVQVATRTGMSADDLAGVLVTERPRTPRGFIHALYLAIRSGFVQRRLVKRARRLLKDRGVPRRTREGLEGLIRSRFQLEQQMMLLKPFQRLFRYWHLLHLPLALVMLLIVVAHVAIAVLFGYA
ncbi:MAG: hypothetical protein IH616_12185 [Gemmatimonadales bacterium]|nr:hypothetical protein [Gemmatimonadales bacterium]